MKKFIFLLIFTLIISCNKDPDIKKYLLGYWNFDNCTAEDLSLNINDGIIKGNLKCIDGIKGKAFEFNENGGIVINIPIVRNFTLGFCFKVENLKNKTYTVLAFEPPDDELKFFFSNGEYQLKMEEKDQDTPFVAVDWVDPKIFHCFVFVNNFDKREQKFYFDGKLVKKKKSAELFNISQLKIGFEDNLKNNFKGVIDEVFIIEKPLSKKEIKKFYKDFIGLEFKQFHKF